MQMRPFTDQSRVEEQVLWVGIFLGNKKNKIPGNIPADKFPFIFKILHHFLLKIDSRETTFLKSFKFSAWLNQINALFHSKKWISKMILTYVLQERINFY